MKLNDFEQYVNEGLTITSEINYICIFGRDAVIWDIFLIY